ncbi:MAG: class I SAM-dependent methyltransferase [Thermoanaerobaculia bacterium]
MHRADVARDVRVFYDRYPYPPPVVDLDRHRAVWQDLDRRRADYHLLWPTAVYREDQQVLVAGCGTSQGAKQALRQPGAHVTAIDISSTSLGHTRDLQRKYDLANLEVFELPLERVGELERRFDKIVCTGVLHHLPDPDAGLRALRNVLKTDGAMYLMVYAPYGRTGVYMLQEYCRRLGIGTSVEEIKDLATTLTALPHGHPLAHLLGEAPDFRSQAGLADALLHPRDRAYTVSQLFDWVKGAGLTFGRWVRQAPYCSRCGALAKSPHASRLAQLAPEEEYAAVELFRGTMVRHTLVAYRDDHPGDSQPIRFDGDRWHAYVPIRLPRTICIDEEQRVPPGAAAVLINQSHTDPDLVLPIDDEETRLLHAIDGTRTIHAIVANTRTSKNQEPLERARSFFDRLWWYDQVVFDASMQT